MTKNDFFGKSFMKMKFSNHFQNIPEPSEEFESANLRQNFSARRRRHNNKSTLDEKNQPSEEMKRPTTHQVKRYKQIVSF